MKVQGQDGRTVTWVYDYANDKPRIKSDMSKEELTPLFVTEDGKEVFDKKKSLIVCTSDFEMCKAPLGYFDSSKVKHFFTKEAAEQYIKDHKPTISIAQLREAGIDPNTLKLWVINGTTQESFKIGVIEKDNKQGVIHCSEGEDIGKETPLETYRKEWDNTMTKIYDFLEKHEC